MVSMSTFGLRLASMHACAYWNAEDGRGKNTLGLKLAARAARY